MTMVDPERKILQKEAFRFRGSVSEALLYTLAAMCNFLSLKHIETKKFQVNGNYGPAVITALPYLAIDGAEPFKFNCEIVDIWIFNRVGGSAGVTELDLKWKAKGTSVWQSIFSGVGGVTPKVNSAAASYEGCGIGDVVNGFVAPIPVKTQFNAGDIIRLDLISAMSGAPSGVEVVIFYRPI